MGEKEIFFCSESIEAHGSADLFVSPRGNWNPLITFTVYLDIA